MSTKRPRSEPPVCAPSKNLNTGFLHFPTAKEVYAHIRNITLPGGEQVVRNFVCVIEDIRPEPSLVETELFPRGALEYYTAKNMGWEYTQEHFTQTVTLREPTRQLHVRIVDSNFDPLPLRGEWSIVLRPTC